MDYSGLIDAAGRKYNVDPKLISSVIATESSGNPNAVGPDTPYGKAVGLGQFIPATAKALGVKDPTDPNQAIPAVAQLLAQNLDRYGSVEKALAAYHGGTDPNNWGPKTQAYVQKVSQAYMGQGQQPQDPAMMAANNALGGGQRMVDPFADAPQAGNSKSASQTGMVDPFASAAPAPNKAATQQSTQKAALSGQSGASNFIDAAGHHLMNMPHGLAQLVEHGANSLVQAVAPNTSFANSVKNVVSNDDAAMAARENNYQSTVPNNAASYTGATIGEILPAFLGGGAGLIEKGEQLAGSLAGKLGLTGVANTTAKVSGKLAGGGTLGALYSAAQPVNQVDNYGQQKENQIGTGALMGVATPILGSALGKLGNYAGNVAASIYRPFTQEGRQVVASDILANAAKGGPTVANPSQIVPGSVPTLAEATANPGIATLQRTLRDLSPNDFIPQEQQNAAARLNAFQNAAGDADQLNFYRTDRQSVADDLYKQAISNYDPSQLTPYLKGQITQLLKRPTINDARQEAQKLAMDRGQKPDPAGSLQSLHDMKTIIDDKISSAVQNNQGGEAKSLQGIKDKLLYVMEKLSPDYAQARVTYDAMSQPVNAMETLQGLNLTDQMGNITLSKVQNAITKIQKLQNQPGVNPAKSVTSDQMNTLIAIRDDLLRAQNSQLGKSVGSATAQNLATQNMFRQALPGKLGMLASQLPNGSIGAGIGGILGLPFGGLPGAAVGSLVGGKIGAGVTALMNTNNDAIQSALIGMLKNPSAGQAALNSATARALPSQTFGSLQRLANPYLIGVGSGAAARSNGQ